MSLLKCIGFDCFPVAVRVIWRLDGYTPVAHRAGVVTFGTKRYFCDVGFGGPQPRAALDLDDYGPQRTGPDTFIFSKAADGDTVISRLTTAGEERLLKFSERPCENVDFLAPNEYQSKNPNSGFKRARMVNIASDDGSIAVCGNMLRVHHNAGLTEKTLETADELKNALKEYFGIEVDFPLKL
jgi:N-hydroxyarylamine O-acetyltransferase